MHRANLKGMNFGSSPSKMHKPCVIGSPAQVTDVNSKDNEMNSDKKINWNCTDDGLR